MKALLGLHRTSSDEEKKESSSLSTVENRQISSPPPVHLPLSMQVMKAFSGLHCVECSNGAHSRRSVLSSSGRQQELTDRETILQKYDLEELGRQNSAASPLVLAPMSSATDTPSSSATIERILTDYITACNFYGCGNRINAGVLTTLRFSLPSMRVSAAFYDADMLALTEILLRYGNGPLQYLHRLDFSIPSKEGHLHGKAGFRSHGALALAKVLQSTQHIKEVYVQRNHVGHYGASALFIACSTNPTVEKLVLRRCRVGERGALFFAELISSASECGLKDVDLSANHIGFRGTLAIEQALVERQAKDMSPIVIDLEGNLVFQEVMNGVTHGLGAVWAMVGAHLLSRRVQDMSHVHVISCAVYSTSLLVLYLSSTLYHSFFTMRNVKWIFEVVDKCAIYIVISGTYTPFLQVVLSQEPIFSVFLLGFQWMCCFLGICIEASYPAWKHRTVFSLIMYLAMGWSAVVCLPEVARILPANAMKLMVLGGVAYTVGIPFFVRNNNLDHSIWHVFVLAGSIFHWLCIYLYVSQVQIHMSPTATITMDPADMDDDPSYFD